MTPTLNRKVTLEEMSEVPDGSGGFTGAWVALGTLWADFLPRSGRGVAHDEIGASQTRFDVVVRAAAHGAPSRPRAGQRLVEGDRIFDILSVSERGERFEYLTLRVEEEVAR